VCMCVCRIVTVHRGILSNMANVEQELRSSGITRYVFYVSGYISNTREPL
jgi:hypothetical protein